MDEEKQMLQKEQKRAKELKEEIKMVAVEEGDHAR